MWDARLILVLWPCVSEHWCSLSVAEPSPRILSLLVDFCFHLFIVCLFLKTESRVLVLNSQLVQGSLRLAAALLPQRLEF